jgi:uncharacterized protein YjiK
VCTVRLWGKTGYVLLAAFAGLLVVAWQFGAFALGYYWISMRNQPAENSAASIWLPDYQVQIDGRAVEGIAENASGLTYNPQTRTLFTVINQPPYICELTVDGVLVRSIPLVGATDPEGITHVREDIFILADEHEQQIFYIRINASTTSVDLHGRPRIGLALDVKENLGFEGISWDSDGKRLFVAKEKSPLRVLEISGLPELLDGSAIDLQIKEWKSPEANSLFMTDLSSLTFHEPTGHMLLLSHESRLIVEYDEDAEPVSIMPLWKGWHGLRHFVPQAEGIAIGENGDLFLLSEPNLFYRFERAVADWKGIP